MVTELSAQDYKYTFSLGTSIGLLNGQAEEIVFRNENSDDKLSQLLWHTNPLVYAGIDLDFDWKKSGNRLGLFVNTSFKFGFPMETGKMEDRDWMDSRYTDFLTHYSVHNNKTDNAVMINANIGAAFSIFRKFLLKTYLAYDYMSFSWTANGGSFLYPKYSDGSEGHRYLNDQQLEVLKYKQFWNIVSPAVSFYGVFNRYFTAEISLKLSPFIWGGAEDNHILRQLEIMHSMQWGFFIEPEFVLLFKPEEWFSLVLSVSYKNISMTRGNGDYDYNDGSTPDLTAKDMIGAGYSALDIGLIAKFRILNK
jgi:outer membrane protease